MCNYHNMCTIELLYITYIYETTIKVRKVEYLFICHLLNKQAHSLEKRMEDNTTKGKKYLKGGNNTFNHIYN